MALTSAVQDLQETTLRAVSGLLRKLEYLATLRDSQGSYFHWGMNRVYGDSAAGKALSNTHRSVLSHILAMPIRKLMDDVERSSEAAGMSAEAYVDRLSASSERLLPPEPGAGSARHLNSVLHALSSLQKVRTAGATSPALWQPPPPDQSPRPLGDTAKL